MAMEAAVDVPVGEIARVGVEALKLLESVVRIFGPWRPMHPQWKAIEAAALQSLTPEQGHLVRKMNRANARRRTSETRLGMAKLELTDIEGGVGRFHQSGSIFRELCRLHLIEVHGEDARSSIRVVGSAEELQEVGGRLVDSMRRRLARAVDLAIRREREVRPAIADAEHRHLREWVAAQWPSLERLVAEFRGLVSLHKLELAALVEPTTKTLQGRWSGSSHCEAILEMLSESLTQIRSPFFPDTLCTVLSGVKWKPLRHQLEVELGSWRKTRIEPLPVAASLGSTDYIFERILVDAGGERLSAPEIFSRAKCNPKTARQFAMSKINSDHRDRIRKLVGRLTQDGFRICGDPPCRGRTQLLWSERAPQLPADASPRQPGPSRS